MAIDADQAIELLIALHAHKTAGYGDAWRKRGELLSIFTNLARKYDRLVVALDSGVTSNDERLHDTAGDLCVYAAKYLTWLAEQHPADFDAVSWSVTAAEATDDGSTRALAAVLRALETGAPGGVPAAWAGLKEAFEPLDVALVAEAEGDATRRLDWEAKVRLAWAICAASAALLLALEADDPAGGHAWRAEIEALGPPPGS